MRREKKYISTDFSHAIFSFYKKREDTGAWREEGREEGGEGDKEKSSEEERRLNKDRREGERGREGERKR